MYTIPYYGTYARFDTASKKDGAVLMNADCIVGDRFTVEIDRDKGERTAWLVNRFGTCVGYLDEETTYRASLCAAQDWRMVALLSFVAFSEQPEPGIYWGQIAFISYDPKSAEIVEPFIERVGKLLGEGIRPVVNLDEVDFSHLKNDAQTWMPSGRAELPPKQKGTVILKSREKFSEKLIEQGRKKNIGCYIVSWAFLLAVVAAFIFSLRSCGII